MNTKHLLALLALASFFILSACSKVTPLTTDNFTCSPNPLVEEGGQVNATITVTYPEKYFNKKATLTIIPVLVASTGAESWGTPVTFQGERINGNDQEINYKYGGMGTFRCSFPYTKEFASSRLRLDFSGELNKKVYTLPSLYIAYGVVALESVCTPLYNNPAFAKDNFIGVTFEKYIATMIYEYRSTTLRESESSQKMEVVALQNALADAEQNEGKQVESVDLVSTASPEGSYKVNEKLAAGRETTSRKFMNKFLESAEQDGRITLQQIAEDWEGFRTLVEQSNIQDKGLILSVLGRINDPDQREKEIRNLAAAYKELTDEILPQLRYTRLTATIRNTARTDDEMMQIWKNDPSQLSLEELLYLAKSGDTSTREAIYKYASKQYPNDYRATNNLGALYFKQGKTDEAASLWRNVLANDIANPEANLNMSLISMLNDDVKSAQTYLGKASECPEYNEAMGTLLVRKGQYAQAVQRFGDAKTNNAAVANICNNNSSAAKIILDNVETKDATTYYLLAVISARTNDIDGIKSNLRKAIGLDSSLRTSIQNDVEFAKYDSVIKSL